MRLINLDPQPPTVTVDEHTKALLEKAQESARRGDTVSLKQSTSHMKRRLEAWRQAKAET